MRKLYFIILALLPSWLKVEFLRLKGHEISRKSHIGMSWLDIKKIRMGEGSRIGSLNVFKGLREVNLECRAGIGNYNQFTANAHYADIAGVDHAKLNLREGAVITMRHYFDCQSAIEIGKDSLVAGLGTAFFTHQKGIKTLHEAKRVDIGERVYLGSSCVVLPGASIRGYAYIVSGSIISGNLHETHAIYSTPRAVVVKKIDDTAAYFSTPDPTGRF